MIEAFLNRALVFTARNVVRSRAQRISGARARYLTSSDTQLRQECRQLLGGDGPATAVAEAPTLGARLTSALLSLTGHRVATAAETRTLALAIECFSRAPADLGDRAALYPTQIAAADLLARGRLVQMDTGEGKTYAILPAAFSLATAHHRVYIVCASDYLAWRDAERTRRYWEFVGLAHGLGLDGAAEAEWSRRVVYTTLHDLLFRSLRDEIGMEPPLHPVTFGAVILDEADAILLDQANQPHRILRALDGRAFDWDFALTFSQQLVPDRHIRVDRASLTATLTVEGGELLREQLVARGIQASGLLLARYAVELSYIATRVVEERHDYVVDASAVRPIDRISGRIADSVTPDWIIPLEISRGWPPRPKTLTLHEGAPLVFLQRFAVLSGTSGTILDEALEYLIDYGIPSVGVPPRFSRQGVVETDPVFRTRQLANQNVVARVQAALAAGRPVLIGTQSIADAEELEATLRPQLPAGARLSVITGLNEQDAGRFFEEAGTVGSVLLATQLAGRGVDIRLSEEARRHGGMVLICLGHAINARHDRQFVGRVGRHGDPFSTVFVCSLEDRLFQAFQPDVARTLMKSVGDDTPIDSPLVHRAIRAGQRQLSQREYLSRRYVNYRSVHESAIHASIRSWFEYLQVPGGDDDVRPMYLSSDFLTRTVDHFVAHHFGALLSGRREITRGGAEEAIATLKGVLKLSDEECPVTSLDLEGHVAREAHGVLGIRLRAELDRRLQARETHDEATRRFYGLYALDGACSRVLDHLRAGTVQRGDAPDVLDDAGGDPALALRAALDVVESEAHALGSLKALAAEIRAAVPHPDGWGALADRLASLQHEVQAAMAATPTPSAPAGRTPRMIAYWSLQLAWSDFLAERDRIEHRARQQGYSELRFHRVVTDRIDQQWSRTEGALSQQVLGNLLRADRSGRLDDLFHIADHPGAAPTRAGTRQRYQFSERRTDPPDADTPGDPAAVLVRIFVTQSVASLRPPMTVSTLTRLLADFMARHPPYTLQTPDRIQRALEDWLSAQVEGGVPADRRQVHKTWLRRFLLYLRDRHLVGALPTFRHTVRSALTRSFASVSEPRTLLVSGGCAAFGVAFAAAAYVAHVFPSRELSTPAAYLDAFLFGGMLASGNLLAAAMGPLLLGAGLLYLVTRSDVQPLAGTGLARFVVPVSQVVVGLWLAWTPPESGVGWVRSVALFLAAVAVATITRWIVWTVQNRTDIDFTAPWLGYCLVFVFLPLATSASVTREGLLAVVATLVVAFLTWETQNHVEFELVSARIESATSLQDAEEVATAGRVTAAVGAGPPILGTVAAGVLLNDFERSGPRELASLAVYLFVVAAWTAIVLRRRLSLRLWLEQINVRRQIIVDATTPPALKRKLQAARVRLFSRELLVHAACVGAVGIWLHGQTLPGTGLPLALVVASSAALLASRGKAFALQLYGFMFSRVPLGRPLLDLSALKEPEEAATFWEAIRRKLRVRIPLTVTILLTAFKAVQEIVGALELWEKLRAYLMF